MTDAGSRQPWLLSLGLHALVGALLLSLLLVPVAPAPQAVRMHLVSGPGKGAPKLAPSPKGWGTIGKAVQRTAEPVLPSWKPAAPLLPSGAASPSVPVSLDELLGAIPVPAPEVPSAVSGSGGWSSAGVEGYAPPPLPPPGLAPPQGARWTLILSIPGGGGFAEHLEGLDSGNPDLDRWLETYLRTVSFPSSLDGKDYQLKWTLRLDSGKPK